MIDGPRIPPASGGPAKSLVVFVHGYGADGNDLIDLGQQFAPILPDTAFVSPHAPDICDESPAGRQWFPLARGDAQRIYAGASGAAPSLDEFLDAELARHELNESQLALVGFSQGTMMALFVGPRRTRQLAGIVGYSGLLAGPERLAGEMKSTPPVLLVHGDADTMVPATALGAAEKALGEAGLSVEAHLRPGLQHGIDLDGLKLGTEFLMRVLQPGPE
jgi:phospholipase/carboxylesterase